METVEESLKLLLKKKGSWMYFPRPLWNKKKIMGFGLPTIFFLKILTANQQFAGAWYLACQRHHPL
jgi:hypothetical protein